LEREIRNRTLHNLVFTGALLLIPVGGAITAQRPEVPVVDGHIGACSADFIVTDQAHRPIYNAKIAVVIRYGFLGLHKVELEVGTNSNGKARVAGLPEKAKKPLEFRVTHGRSSKKLMVNPSAKCNAAFEVSLAIQ
jgi:hypothetical protein